MRRERLAETVSIVWGRRCTSQYPANAKRQSLGGSPEISVAGTLLGPKRVVEFHFGSQHGSAAESLEPETQPGRRSGGERHGLDAGAPNRTSRSHLGARDAA